MSNTGDKKFEDDNNNHHEFMPMEYESPEDDCVSSNRDKNEFQPNFQCGTMEVEEIQGPSNPANQLVLDRDPQTYEESVTVNEKLVSVLKPHQREGVEFMYQAVKKASGCILAHCMGLGKTLQVITVIHTLLTHQHIGVKTVLVLCPLGTILNWKNEFEKWLENLNDQKITIHDLTKSRKNEERLKNLETWIEQGGVMIISHDTFRSMLTHKKIDVYLRERISCTLLRPGCDLVVCDEGHVLKKESTILSKTMMKIETKRRILLTGTPLQNNLMEYYCMVQFVAPDLLGSKKDFQNRFGHPITKGQFADSEAKDVSVMKQRTCSLHKLSFGIIHRKDHKILESYLRPKHEFVVIIGLSDFQVTLYRHYLMNHSWLASEKRDMKLLIDYNKMRLIWTHPLGLKFGEERNQENFSVEPWWLQLVSGVDLEDLEIGPKVIVLFDLIRESEKMGDKVLVFSQSLPSLDVIECFLKKSNEHSKHFSQPASCSTDFDNFNSTYSTIWEKDVDYFRMDGQTSQEDRAKYCDIFNDPKNKRARLFLISTKTGGLGINLTGANRVVVFDASWNPSNDVQSVFRVFRFGQNKPCYIYRLVSQGTMEEIIYRRQITKLSLAHRVIDEELIDRHFTLNNVGDLYAFSPGGAKSEDLGTKAINDVVMNRVLKNHSGIIVDLNDQESFFSVIEELTEEEREKANEHFQRSKSERVNKKRASKIKTRIRSTLGKISGASISDSDLDEWYEKLLEYYTRKKERNGTGEQNSRKKNPGTDGNSSFLGTHRPIFNMGIKKVRKKPITPEMRMEQLALLHALRMQPVDVFLSGGTKEAGITPSTWRLWCKGKVPTDLKVTCRTEFGSWSNQLRPDFSQVRSSLLLHFKFCITKRKLQEKLLDKYEGLRIEFVRPDFKTVESLLS